LASAVDYYLSPSMSMSTVIPTLRLRLLKRRKRKEEQAW
jgi:hypothetical protein